MCGTPVRSSGELRPCLGASTGLEDRRPPRGLVDVVMSTPAAGSSLQTGATGPHGASSGRLGGKTDAAAGSGCCRGNAVTRCEFGAAVRALTKPSTGGGR